MHKLNTAEPRRLVLVGGGHTHVQVLRHLTMNTWPVPTHTTLVVDDPVAVYSGMVPGFVAGQYEQSALEIDVVPLAARSRVAVVLHRCDGIDPERREIQLEGRAPLPYDLVSFDVGSTVAGLDLPGITTHALPTRPISLFVQRIAELDRIAASRESLSLVVVGGGAGGVEVAFTARERLRRSFPQLRLSVSLLFDADRLLATYARRLSKRVEQAASRRGIELRPGARVSAITENSVLLADGTAIPADAVLWVTGARPHPLFDGSGLPQDERGFIATQATLQVEGHSDIFAVGDCGTQRQAPAAKAGVFAVRQGPYLIRNLENVLLGLPLVAYRPQRDFLTLLNLGDGTAIGAKWGTVFGGAWVMRWKDRIDRRFMERFQVLLGDTIAPAFQVQRMEADEPMLCGGCAAKVPSDELERALHRLPASLPHRHSLVGMREADDAALYETPLGERIAVSVDAFRAFIDDPWLVGRVAAVNALSDLFAKGVVPRTALATVVIPSELSARHAEDMLFQTLSGVRSTLDEEGVELLGGHTLTGPELVVGLTVEGWLTTTRQPRAAKHPADQEPLRGGFPLPLNGLRKDDALVLTKPLGTGVLLQAHMQGRCTGPWLRNAFFSMKHSNGIAMEAALEVGAHAATDVSGFGLATHLVEMLVASNRSAAIELDRLPALPGALELLGQGLRSTFHAQNAGVLRRVDVADDRLGDPRLELLFDPQTSGGLLLGLGAEQAVDLLAILQRRGVQATLIGLAGPARTPPLWLV